MMAVKKETGTIKIEQCIYCNKTNCHCIKWIFFLKAVILLIFGYMLLKGYWTLTQTIGYLLILLGLKYLIFGFKCR